MSDISTISSDKKTNYHNESAVIVHPQELPENQLEVQKMIDALEVEIAKGETVDFPLRHFFAKSVYVREFSIKKGFVVTGKVHKYSHVIILLTGEIMVNMEGGVVTIKAPYVGITPAGSRRAVFANEDSVILTAHGTDETDLDKLEEQIIAQTYTEYLEFSKSLENKGEQT